MNSKIDKTREMEFMKHYKGNGVLCKVKTSAMQIVGDTLLNAIKDLWYLENIHWICLKTL